MSLDIAIIGAGLSGAILYDRLKHNHNITIFEKSRGVGGRCSTRYIKDLKIDHGTHDFSTKDQEFNLFCSRLISLDILEKKELSYTPIDGINQMISVLIDDEKLLSQTKIVKAYTKDKKWVLEDDQKNIFGDFDILLSTIPAPQVLQLDTSLSADIQEQLHKVSYEPIATMIAYNSTLNIKQIEKLQKNPFFKKISIQKDAIVFHANHEVSQQINSKQSIEKIFIDEIQATINLNISKSFQTLPHLWRYALVKDSLTLSSIYDKKNRFGLCGDYFLQKNLESSYKSALSLINQL